MKTLGKRNYAHRGAARGAASIGQLPGLICPEVMHALAGSRHVLMCARETS